MAKRQPRIKSSTEKNNLTAGITTPKIKNSNDTINEYAGRGFQQTNG